MNIVPLIFHLLNVIIIWAILVLAQNFNEGTAGIFNMGHAAFYCVGAYSSALLSKAGLPWIFCVMAAMLFSALLALFYGLPTLKLRADYFSIITLGLGEITRTVALNWQSLTGGPNGLAGIPKPNIFGFEINRGFGTIVLGVIALVFVYLLLERWRKSAYGRAIRAIREDPLAAESMGKNMYTMRLRWFIIAAAIAGFAGSLYSHYHGYISPSAFALWVMFNGTLTFRMGGVGNYFGTIIAAVVFILLREGLNFLPVPSNMQGTVQQFILAALLIFIMLRFPRGLFPELPTITTKILSRRKKGVLIEQPE